MQVGIQIGYLIGYIKILFPRPTSTELFHMAVIVHRRINIISKELFGNK